MSVPNHLTTSSIRSSILDSRITTLDNGLRVVSINLPHVESASVGVFVNIGSRNETPELNGISHVFEHMAFKGTKTRSAEQVSNDIEYLGADINAYTSKDRTAYHVTGLRENIPIFVELLADVLKNSTFPADELERERKVIQQEISKYKDEHQSCAYELHDTVLYGDQPLGRPIIGTTENVDAITRDDLLAYMAAHYTGVNMIVGVVGNLDHDEVLALVTSHFSSIDRGVLNTSVLPKYEGGYDSQFFDIEQSHILLSFPAANSVDPLHYAEAIASTVLSDGLSSPLLTEVREKRGLVYTISSFTDMLNDAGTFYIYAATTQDNFEALFPVVLEELRKLTVSVNPRDLQRAKNQLRVRLTRRQERGFGLLSSTIENLFTYGHTPSLIDTLDKIANVTEDDVKAAFTRWLSAKPSLSISGPGADIAHYNTVLAALGQDRISVSDQALDDLNSDSVYEALNAIETAKREYKSV
jgi:predicted Zn-dependent peptidase